MTIEPPPPTLPSFSLQGQTVVVTGAASGIGRATALAAARSGANCLIHARSNIDGAVQTADAVRQFDVDALVVLADFHDPVEHDRLMDVAWNWRGQVDAWVNNAGADVLTGAAAEWSFEEKLAEILQVDVTAAMRLSRAAGQRMQQRGGAIVNIGWDQAEFGMAGDSGEMFAASKGAIMAFTRSLAKSLAPQVRVNCVAPGWIRTLWGEQQASEYWRQRAVQESLLARWGTPEDVAQAIVYLISPAASFLTGVTLPVNGGRRTT